MRKQIYIPVLIASLSLAMAQDHKVSILSLTATVQDTFTRKLVDGNVVTKTVSGQFYRDSEGRTRTERDQMVTIQDPTTRTIIVIDARSKVARRFTAPAPRSAATSGPSMSGATRRQEHKDLGTQVIEGVVTRGQEFSVVLPPGAIGNLGPLKQTLEVWHSDELALAVKTVSNDPVNGERVQIYRNIVKGVQVDPSLFRIPPNVQVVDVAPAAHSGSQRLR